MNKPFQMTFLKPKFIHLLSEIYGLVRLFIMDKIFYNQMLVKAAALPHRTMAEK